MCLAGLQENSKSIVKVVQSSFVSVPASEPTRITCGSRLRRMLVMAAFRLKQRIQGSQESKIDGSAFIHLQHVPLRISPSLGMYRCNQLSLGWSTLGSSVPPSTFQRSLVHTGPPCLSVDLLFGPGVQRQPWAPGPNSCPKTCKQHVLAI